MNVLSSAETKKRIKKLPANWFISGDGLLSSEFSFDSVAQAKAFINSVIDVAEELNHHPNLTWQFKTVEISVTTHQAQGLTNLDFKFAARVEKCLKKP